MTRQPLRQPRHKTPSPVKAEDKRPMEGWGELGMKHGLWFKSRSDR